MTKILHPSYTVVVVKSGAILLSRKNNKAHSLMYKLDPFFWAVFLDLKCESTIDT